MYLIKLDSEQMKTNPQVKVQWRRQFRGARAEFNKGRDSLC